VFDWCHEEYGAYPEGVSDDDVEGNLKISREFHRVLRGGSFDVAPSPVRSANRNLDVPTARNGLYGFRVARTLRPGSLTPLPNQGGTGETVGGDAGELT
jgi:formylglycine-generating enzyme required for sulfatase activity